MTEAVAGVGFIRTNFCVTPGRVLSVTRLTPGIGPVGVAEPPPPQAAKPAKAALASAAANHLYWKIMV
jgi:hypothetical protein